MKMTLLPDHIPVNNFQLIVVGAPPIHFVTVDGIEEELDTTELPDRTRASGGNTKPVEFTATHPLHHIIEDAFLQLWWIESQDPVSPTYKKVGTLIKQSISRLNTKTINLIGMFPTKQKSADNDENNEGELDVNEWTFSADLPIRT